ncbi:hypothetical protein KIPB_016016, partial [Kipferlia bialata]|eukprot:g16016.t1
MREKQRQHIEQIQEDVVRKETKECSFSPTINEVSRSMAKNATK